MEKGHNSQYTDEVEGGETTPNLCIHQKRCLEVGYDDVTSFCYSK